MNLERDHDGYWCLVIPQADCTYDAVHGVRVKHRLELPKRATLGEAVEYVERELGRENDD